MRFRLVLVVAAATAMFAQGPGGLHMHGMAAHSTTAVQNYLNLTSAQISSLQQLRQSEMAALKPIYEQIRPLRETLRTQEEGSSADATGVGQTVLSIKSLEQQAAPIRASFQQQALAVLTAAQKTQLAALQNAMSLMPAMHEAMSLNLLTPPTSGPGSAEFGPEMMPPGRFGGR